MTILITGNPVDGFTYIGPFASFEETIEYAEQQLDGDWWTAPIVAIEELATP